jgi:hypothetical protein
MDLCLILICSLTAILKSYSAWLFSVQLRKLGVAVFEVA